MPSPPPASSGYNAKIIFGGISLLVALFLAETAAGVIGLGQPYHIVTSSFGEPHLMPIKTSGYLPFTTPTSKESLEAAAEGFNDLGYRGKYPLTIEKPEGASRILLLGDSFTIGWLVPEEDTFSARLRERMSRDGLPVEVINAAYHSGNSPDSYYAYMVREGLDLEPDIVVMNIYISNDVTDLTSMVWRKTDTNGGPTSLYTTRNYVDYRGGLVGPERYWYYRIPLLRESHLFTAFGKAVTPEQFLPEITTVEDLRARYAGVLLAMKALSEQHNFDLYVIAFDVEGFPLAAPSYEYYAIYTVDVLGPETALALVDQFPTDELLIGDGHFAWPAHVRYEEFLYTFIQPSLREIDPTQPGPLTEAEFALLVSLPPFADKSLCGAFQSVWGRQPIIPNQYPGCADKLPTGVEVACLDDRGQWTQDSVASQQVENGIFWAEVLQGGTCGLFQTTNNVK